MAEAKTIAIIGGGYTGLAAAYECVRRGMKPVVLEAAAEVGGLAGTFQVGDVRLERFYHHWFTSDQHIMELIRELGADGDILLRPTRTGMFYANRFHRLSSPLDVLRFTPLSFVDRIRLGLMVLKARKVKDWRELEGLTAKEWLCRIGGEAVWRVVWEPLMRGKFGAESEHVSAVWMWNKLKLRGGSRGKGGREELAYFRGGFAALIDRLVQAITAQGGVVRTGSPVAGIISADGRAAGVRLADGEEIRADAVVATPALPLLADLVAPVCGDAYADSLRRIRYLGNVCLVLQLDRSLSDTYWTNVNDPDFPYVAVIEHTNFEPATTYEGRHIVYLSKYLPTDADLYRMSETQVVEFSIPHLQRMFPAFRREWIQAAHVWRAEHSQPIVCKQYGALIPDARSPLPGLYLASMAQIYPEDRGTNYAIREGRRVVPLIVADLNRS